MATQVQFRGGTTSEHSTFTGVAREVTVDTTKKTVVVHDGSTAGGIPLAKESAVTSAAAITGGSINGTTVGASTASTGRFTTVTATGLTSGRVTYAGASGLLSDSANLTFDGTKLTSAGLVSTGALNVSGSGWGVLPYVANSLVVDSNAGETRLFATGTNTSTQGNFLFYTGTTNGTASERMRITSAGLVGIGTSSPTSPLQVSKAQNAGTSILVTNTTSNTSAFSSLQLDGGSNSAYIYQFSAGYTSSGPYVANATTFDFPSQFIFSNGGTERMRLDSAGNLGLGVTPSSFQSVDKVIQIGAQGSIDYSSGNFLISNNFSNPSGVDKYIASTYATMYYQSTAGQHIWRLAPSGTAGNNITWTQAMTLDASGNLLVGTTTTRANAGDVQVSKGISFPATQSAQSDANTLDDYEEGTWTPGFGTGWVTSPSVATTATYVKIGKQVTVSVYLLDGVSTAGALITGLPFSVSVESSMTGFSGSTSTAPLMTGVTQSGTSQIRSIPAATMTSLYWTVSTTYFTT